VAGIVLGAGIDGSQIQSAEQLLMHSEFEVHDIDQRVAAAFGDGLLLGLSGVEQVKGELAYLELFAWADADEFAYTFAGGIRAAADGDALEFFGRRLQDVLYSRLFDVFEELGKQIWQSTQGGGETGGFLASVGSAVFGGGKAMGGPVQPGKFYAWQEQGREYFAPTVPGKVIPESAMHGRGGPVVVNQFHLHAEGAVMTDELLREMDAKAEAAGRTAVAVSRNDLASIRKRQSRRLG
ncbi:MAG: hypothetical protein ACOC20_03440, partial [Oceanicaulis sp.]